MTRGAGAVLASVAVLAVGLVGLVAADPVAADSSYAVDTPRSTWEWRVVDPHVHSVVSGDAVDDVGVLAAAAEARGLDAIFVTDHQAATYGNIGGVTSAHVRLDDSLENWTVATAGIPTATTVELSGDQARSGASSVHLRADAGSTYGEGFAWLRRGPNLRTNDVTLHFSAFPTHIEPGTGLYVSVSLGGDPSIPARPPDGYTTDGGTVAVGRSTVLVYQLGSPRLPSTDPERRVVTTSLPFTPGQWNDFDIDLDAALEGLFPPGQRPTPENAFVSIKVAAGATAGGFVDGYIDNVRIDQSHPLPTSAASAADFVARNQVIASLDSGADVIAAREVGVTAHVQELAYDIDDPGDWVQAQRGVDLVASIQERGIPAVLNHPGLPGGVTEAEALEHDAYGAEAMEAVERANGSDVTIRTWEAILATYDRPLIGVWSSDGHRADGFGPAMHLLVPEPTPAAYLRSLFEGRSFMGRTDFGGTLSLRPATSGEGIYPAQYPMYVSPARTTLPIRATIDGGLRPGYSVRWVVDGTTLASDAITPGAGSSYDVTRSVPIDAAAGSFVRLEVLGNTGRRQAMSQALLVRPGVGYAAPFEVHVTSVATPDGWGYTSSRIHGIVGTSYDQASATLRVELQNTVGSLVGVEAATGANTIDGVTAGGVALARFATAAELQASGGPGWSSDGGSTLVSAGQSAPSMSVQLHLVGGVDSEPPSAPPSLDARALDARHVQLRWEAAADDVGIARYEVRRGGTVIVTLPGAELSFVDAGAPPASTVTYSVRAVDAGGNESPLASATTTTPPLSSTTVTVAADTYVTPGSSSPAGRQTTIRADGDPPTTAFVRFDVPVVAGRIVGATLRPTPTQNHPTGVSVHAVADSSWSETTMVNATAPAVGAVVGTSGRLTGGVTPSIPVAVEGAGIVEGSPVSLALRTASTTAVAFPSREAAAGGMQLVLEVSSTAPTAGDQLLAVDEDASVDFVPDVGDDDGDALTCAVAELPASGTVTVEDDCSSATYAPSPDVTGADRFRIAVTDGRSSDDSVISVEIAPVNDPPRFDDEALGASVPEDGSVELLLRAQDIDGDCPLDVELVTPPAHGSLSTIVDGDCSGGGATASTTYTPAPGYGGPDAFTVVVTDPAGATSANVEIPLVVDPVPDPPTAGPVAVTTVAGSTTTWTPLAADDDGDELVCEAIDVPPSLAVSIAADCSTATLRASAAGSFAFGYRVLAGGDEAVGAVSVTASAEVTFADDVETGDLRRWSSTSAAVVEAGAAHAGSFGIRLQSNGGPASYVRAASSSSGSTLTSSLWLNVASRPTTSGGATVLRLRTSTSTALVTLSFDRNGLLRIRNDRTGVLTASTTPLPTASWHRIELRLNVVASGPDTVEVLLDGTSVPALALSTEVGAVGPAQIQVGESNAGTNVAYSFAVDDVVVTR